MLSIAALILTRLKNITLYWALNFVKQEATYIWRTLTVFPVEPNKSLNNVVLLAGYFQVWPKLNMKCSYKSITRWNALENQMRSIQDVDAFKKSLKCIFKPRML